MGSSFGFDWRFEPLSCLFPLFPEFHHPLYLLGLLVHHQLRTLKVQICRYYFERGDFQQLLEKESDRFQVGSFLGNKFKHPTGAEMTFEPGFAKLIGWLAIIGSRPELSAPLQSCVKLTTATSLPFLRVQLEIPANNRDNRVLPRSWQLFFYKE